MELQNLCNTVTSMSINAIFRSWNAVSKQNEYIWVKQIYNNLPKNSLRAGFEPAREDPIGFQVQRLNHSAITALTALVVSCDNCVRMRTRHGVRSCVYVRVCECIYVQAFVCVYLQLKYIYIRIFWTITQKIRVYFTYRRPKATNYVYPNKYPTAVIFLAR